MKKTLMSKKYHSMLLGGTLSMVIGVLASIADSIIAGNMLGKDALAGVNLITPLFSAALFMGMLFSIGIPIMYTKEMGAFNKKEADRIFGFGLLTTCGTGLILLILFHFCESAYLTFYHADQSVLEYARSYSSWMKLVFLVAPIQTYMNAMIFADGDEMLTTIADAVQFITSLPLSIILCRLIGTAGLSQGIFISFVLSLVIMLFHFRKKTNSLRASLCFSLKYLKKTVKLSAVDSGNYLFLALFTCGLEKLIVTRFGADKLPVASVIILLTSLQIIFDGIGEAIQPTIGLYLSVGNTQGVRNIYRLAKRTSLIEGCLIMLIVILSAPLIPGFLGIREPELLPLSVAAMRIISTGYIFTSFLFLQSSYYLLREMILLAFMISGLCNVLIPLPMAILCGVCFGMYGMFWGLAISPFVAYLLCRTCISFRYGKNAYPLMLDTMEENAEVLMYEFEITSSEVLRVQEEVRDALRSRGFENRSIVKVMFLLEELFMLISDHNRERVILGECMLSIRPDSIQIIEMDDGVIFNLTDTDMGVDSFRTYIMTNVFENWTKQRSHLMAVSVNRNAFIVPLRSKEDIPEPKLPNELPVQ